LPQFVSASNFYFYSLTGGSTQTVFVQAMLIANVEPFFGFGLHVFQSFKGIHI
jgi:hypothetical protein